MKAPHREFTETQKWIITMGLGIVLFAIIVGSRVAIEYFSYALICNFFMIAIAFAGIESIISVYDVAGRRLQVRFYIRTLLLGTLVVIAGPLLLQLYKYGVAFEDYNLFSWIFYFGHACTWGGLLIYYEWQWSFKDRLRFPELSARTEEARNLLAGKLLEQIRDHGTLRREYIYKYKDQNLSTLPYLWAGLVVSLFIYTEIGRLLHWLVFTSILLLFEFYVLYWMGREGLVLNSNGIEKLGIFEKFSINWKDIKRIVEVRLSFDSTAGEISSDESGARQLLLIDKSGSFVTIKDHYEGYILLPRLISLVTNLPIELDYLKTAQKDADTSKALPTDITRKSEYSVPETKANCQICGQVDAYEQLRFGVKAVLCNRCRARLGIIFQTKISIWIAIIFSVGTILFSIFASKESPITDLGPQIYYLNFGFTLLAILLTWRSFRKKRELNVVPFGICLIISVAMTMSAMLSYQRNHPALYLNDPNTAIAYDPEHYNPAVSDANAQLGIGIVFTTILILGINIIGKLDWLAYAHLIDNFGFIKKVELRINTRQIGEEAAFETTFELRTKDQSGNLAKIVTRTIQVQSDSAELAELKILLLALRRLKSRLYHRPATYELQFHGLHSSLSNILQQDLPSNSIAADRLLEQIHDLLNSFPTVEWFTTNETSQQTH